MAEVIITNFRLNFQTPDALMEVLALKCRESIEKCIFQINTKNEIIGIENHEEIIQNWNRIKENLVQENEGEIFEKYPRWRELVPLIKSKNTLKCFKTKEHLLN